MQKPSFWVAMFSRTGSELVSLSEKLEFKPDIVLTNSKQIDEKVFSLSSHGTRVIVDKHESLMEDLDELIDLIGAPVITLHGYMRILPLDITKYSKIFNGHPGLITKYPILKGKDPQETLWANMSLYEEMGSVVHRVTGEVDSGEVLVEESIPVTRSLTHEQVYAALRVTSRKAWMKFFERELWK